MNTIRRWASSRSALTGLGRASRRKQEARPRLEALEGRALLAMFSVTNNADVGVGSLRWAVSQSNLAPGADIIKFDNVSGLIKLTSGSLNIFGDLEINGPGMEKLTIDAGGQSRVFLVDGVIDVALTDLTISGGYAEDQGGGILNEDADLVLKRVLLTGNKVLSKTGVARGGGVASVGGPDTALHVFDSIISYNTSEGAKGEQKSKGYGRDAKGGGIYIGNNGHLEIRDSSIHGNRARGGVSLGQLPDERGGYASGGGVFLEPSTFAESEGTTYEENLALGGDGANVLLGGKGGPAQGGAVYAAQVFHSSGDSFTWNKAQGGVGNRADNAGPHRGGYALGGALRSGPDLILFDTHFTYNEAVGGASRNGDGGWAHGGGAYIPEGNTPNPLAFIEASSFFDNEARGGKSGNDKESHGGNARGGGLMTGLFTMVIDTNFESNLAVGGESGKAKTFAGDGLGGGFYVSDTTIQLSGETEVVANEARGGASAAADAGAGNAHGGGAYLGEDAQLISEGIVYRDNLARGGSGEKNKTGGLAFGGGLYLDGATATMTGSDLIRNAAVGGVEGGSAHGGGLYGTKSSLTIEEGEIHQNTATGVESTLGTGGFANGGGISLWDNTAFHLDHVDITENIATGGNNVALGTGGSAHGGGIDISWTWNVTMNEVLFEANQAVGGIGAVGGGFGVGGAMDVLASSISLTHVDFYSNLAVGGYSTSGDLAPGWGGAISYGGLSWVWMFDVNFALNQATKQGDNEFGTNLA